MVVHITGCSGSGKTTLGRKLARRGVEVIDLDKIEDAIALELLGKPSIQAALKGSKTRKAAFERFQRVRRRFFLREVRKVIQAAKEKSGKSTIVLIGVTLKEAGSFADRKYFLDSTPSLIFKRLNIRSLELFSRHGRELKKMFSTREKLKVGSSAIVELTVLFKYEIRGPFPISFEDASKVFHRVKERSMKGNYLVRSADEIYREILQLSGSRNRPGRGPTDAPK